MPAARLVARLSAPASLLSTCERRTTIGLARVAGSGLWPSSALLSQPHPPTSVHSPIAIRHASNSSSTRWLNRQSRDPYTKGSKLSALKSRAAFKLLEINEKHHLFRPGQTVVDLGYAPGSWSQVAKSRVGENGKVVGIDVIPAQPPRGVSTLQGDFLSESVQGRLREYVREQDERIRRLDLQQGDREEDELEEEAEQSVVERARAPSPASSPAAGEESGENTGKQSQRAQDAALGRVVDVVLSDMCAPWPLEINSWIKSVNTPFRRMMNTSGNSFRDHAGSMDLCTAALLFSCDCLVTGGNFLCKFYQGAEDKAYEMKLKKLFEKVYRIKPESSRRESKEAYFVGLRRRKDVGRREVFGDGDQ